MVSVVENQDETTYEGFCEEWLDEFQNGALSPFEKGQRFAIKLVTQWLDVTGDDEDLVLCDGPGDGGIDIAYLHRADIDDSDPGRPVSRGRHLVFDSKQIRDCVPRQRHHSQRREQGNLDARR